MINALLDVVYSLDQIRGRLLVAWRRVFEIRQGTLKLESIIEILDETRCNIEIEGNTDEAVIGAPRVECIGTLGTVKFRNLGYTAPAGQP